MSMHGCLILPAVPSFFAFQQLGQMKTSTVLSVPQPLRLRSPCWTSTRYTLHLCVMVVTKRSGDVIAVRIERCPSCGIRF